jgi:hypothetical protein
MVWKAFQSGAAFSGAPISELQRFLLSFFHKEASYYFSCCKTFLFRTTIYDEIELFKKTAKNGVRTAAAAVQKCLAIVA